MAGQQQKVVKRELTSDEEKAVSDALNEKLDGDDLADVMEFLLNFLGKWRDLGDKVGVRQGKLDEIAEDNRRARDCMKKVILEWLHGNGNVDAFPPTRQGLMDALRSPLVEESGVADEIKQRIIEKIHKDIN